MSTFHADALHAAVDEVLQEDPSREAFLAEIVRRLKAKVYASPWPDIIKQTPYKPAYDLYDAYVFAYVWQRIWDGHIVVLNLALGSGPRRDMDRAYNDGVLKRLRPPLSGTFDGRGDDNDGCITWAAPLPFERFSCTDAECPHDTHPAQLQMVEPWRAPLEVGSTQASKTLDHLLRDRGLARWPYGSTSLYVLRDLERVQVDALY